MNKYNKSQNNSNSEFFWDNFLDKCLEQNNVESAIGEVTKAILDCLGDKSAHLKPGGLNEGEIQYSVSAAVIISKDKAFNIFLLSRIFLSTNMG